VLAADAELERSLVAAALLDAHLDQLAHARLVEALERVDDGRISWARYSGRNAPDVVAAVAERQLRQVVGAEAEEVGDLGDLVGGDRRPRDLDHRADLDIELGR
jgi:hypothetical protein